MSNQDSTDTARQLAAVRPLLFNAVNTDGAHHKQWFLEQIAKVLNVSLPDHEPGVAP